MSAARPDRPRRQSLRAIFFAPAVIAAATSAGLLSALLGDGVWDAVSWLALSVPVAVVVWYAWFVRR